MTRKPPLVFLVVLVALLVAVPGATAQGPGSPPRAVLAAPAGTAFTYQGLLKNASGPVTGACNFQFSLWDSLAAGTGQVGGTLTLNNVQVANGLFVVSLDFGNVFDGSARFLQVAPQCGSDPGFTALSPRQALNPTPYAVYSLSAGAAATANFATSAGSATTAGSATSAGSASVAASALALQGNAVSGASPAAGQALMWDGSKWAPQAPPAYSAGAGLALAGTQFAIDPTVVRQKYANVKVVAKAGGDFATIGAALAAIADNGAGNRYLVYVAPGTYTESVAMKPYVDIEGAGEGTTKVTSAGSAALNTGTVVGASNAALRFLAVENTGGAVYAVAIYNGGASPKLTRVTASASGGSSNHGVSNNSSSPAMTDVTTTASGGGTNFGVSNVSSAPAVTGVTASASGGGQQRRRDQRRFIAFHQREPPERSPGALCGRRLHRLRERVPAGRRQGGPGRLPLCRRVRRHVHGARPLVLKRAGGRGDAMATRRLLVPAGPLVGGLLHDGAALAQGGYDLAWYKAAQGGASAGGAYSLGGAAGQADAGSLTGGVYSLDGGFLAGLATSKPTATATPTATPTSQPAPGASGVYLPFIRK
jgi:hypothetical protein